ncbi:MAG: PD-(D/E)XK nuclease family protein [Alphaproteobacteria bacterium]|nr:PD-(D/E)XK nuclease family protein [Alphaproteobacteria bacterium]
MIYNIPSSYPFMENLVQFILDKEGNVAQNLAECVLIVPTERAALEAQKAFIRALNGKASLLPRIFPVYRLENLETPSKEPLSEMERLFLLMRLIGKKEPSITSDQAFALATSLADFLDEFSLNKVPLEALQNIVPDTFSAHWQETLNFLEIIRTFYPEILADKQDIGKYKIEKIDALTQSWKETPPLYPVIMAGFTGGIPSVRGLIDLVSRLPKGTVILDGVMSDLSEKEWKSITQTHPQFELKRLLGDMHLRPQAILPLPFLKNETAPFSRKELIYKALKPASNLEEWANDASINFKQALENVSLFEYETLQEEALGIALCLRKVLEEKGKTAALVTSDRTLAKRVIAEMKRWNILLDDSAGKPFLKTSLGAFLSLIVQYASDNASQTTLLSLLKHPLTTNKMSQKECRQSVYTFEKDLRQEKEVSFGFNVSLPLVDLFKDNVPHSFLDFLNAHIQSAENLATSADKTGQERLWKNEHSNEIEAFFDEIKKAGGSLSLQTGEEYKYFILSLFKTLLIRPKYGMHPRLDILGPIEARLQNPDVVILGEMNEGVWPKEAVESPWINRSMRLDCGLPSMDEKIGVNAHDFVQNFMKKEVILTRALKKENTLSIPSQFLLRLQAFLQAQNYEWTAKKDSLIGFMEEIPPYMPQEEPHPKPDVSFRPVDFSVSEIELLRKDPYAIYAKRILKLKKLRPLDEEASNRDFGNAVHDILNLYVRKEASLQTLETLLSLGKEVFEKTALDAFHLNFYLSRFEKIARWFVSIQQERTAEIKQIITEEKGFMHIENKGVSWKIRARADRIDLLSNGLLRLIDYKTGGIPSKPAVKAGYAPQLVLEGLIAQKGGFEFQHNEKATLSNLEYWRIQGKTKSGEISLAVNQKELEKTLEQTENGIRELISFYNDKDTSYEICPAPEHIPTYNDYEDLERLSEWNDEQGGASDDK